MNNHQLSSNFVSASAPNEITDYHLASYIRVSQSLQRARRECQGLRRRLRDTEARLDAQNTTHQEQMEKVVNDYQDVAQAYGQLYQIHDGVRKTFHQLGAQVARFLYFDHRNIIRPRLEGPPQPAGLIEAAPVEDTTGPSSEDESERVVTDSDEARTYYARAGRREPIAPCSTPVYDSNSDVSMNVSSGKGKARADLC